MTSAPWEPNGSSRSVKEDVLAHHHNCENTNCQIEFECPETELDEEQCETDHRKRNDPILCEECTEARDRDEDAEPWVHDGPDEDWEDEPSEYEPDPAEETGY